MCGQDLTDTPVPNPRHWFGWACLIEIGGSYWPLFIATEEDRAHDGTDEPKDTDLIIEDDTDRGIGKTPSPETSTWLPTYSLPTAVPSPCSRR